MHVLILILIYIFSLNRNYRTKTLERIAEENMGIAKRLELVKPYYHVDKWVRLICHNFSLYHTATKTTSVLACHNFCCRYQGIPCKRGKAALP